MAKQKLKRKSHEILLTSLYVETTVDKKVSFIGTEKEAEAFCKNHYKHFKSCKLNGREQNRTVQS